MQALELKIPPVALFLICSTGMWAISEVLPTAVFTLPSAAIIAVALALLGGAIAVAGVVQFRRQSTTVNPTRPEEATSVVRSGIFRITRNPMYLGLATVLMAWAIYLRNTAALLLLPVFVAYLTRFQIRPEERALLTQFGHEYADYIARVRRWL
jgi:protein-S-isoprenylcysteine O-methyltransferase Ste14